MDTYKVDFVFSFIVKAEGMADAEDAAAEIIEDMVNNRSEDLWPANEIHISQVDKKV